MCWRVDRLPINMRYMQMFRRLRPLNFIVVSGLFLVWMVVGCGRGGGQIGADDYFRVGDHPGVIVW